MLLVGHCSVRCLLGITVGCFSLDIIVCGVCWTLQCKVFVGKHSGRLCLDIVVCRVCWTLQFHELYGQ